MREAQQGQAVQVQVVPATPVVPAAPAPTAAQGVGQTPAPIAAPTAGVNLSQFNVAQLRRMLSELRDQRAEMASRRSNTGDIYENSTGANKEGIGERLRILDANIIDFEKEIARVGREIAARGGGSTVEQPPPGGIPGNYMHEDDAAFGMFATFMTGTVLAVFFTRRFMRKRYGRAPTAQTPNMIASNERLDRIEQAVDTIAVEIERVSENQRFMTRLMTETQLGDTIKDVRKSTELARSAASESSG